MAMNRRNFLLGATALATAAGLPFGAKAELIALIEQKIALYTEEYFVLIQPTMLELLMAPPDPGWAVSGPVFDGKIGLYEGINFVEP